ncbi:MAG: twin-arginine translocation signal domain-containing protein [bacterium]
MEEKDIKNNISEEIDAQEKDDESNNDRRAFIKKAAVTAAAVSGIALGLAKKSEGQSWLTPISTTKSPFTFTPAQPVHAIQPVQGTQTGQASQPAQTTQQATTATSVQPTKLALNAQNIRQQMDMKQNMVHDLGMAAQKLQETRNVGEFVPAVLDNVREYMESMVDAHLGSMGSQAADYNITAVTDNITISGDIVYGKDLREQALSESIMGGLFRR